MLLRMGRRINFTGAWAATFAQSSGQRRRLTRPLRWGGVLLVAVLVLSILWLAIVIRIDKSAQPIVPPRITLLTREGQPFAQQGPLMAAPVRVAALPMHVQNAFFAIEDRRFRSHWGVDPIGIARSLVNNLTGGGRQGGSTITQQLVKNVYLTGKDGRPAITYGRKLQEMAIAVWLEFWLTKDQILERYLSNVQFGNNVFGLRAASLHYFYRQPENLTLEQAVMLAGLVQAPNRFDPTRNLERAQKRARMVVSAMAKAHYITEGEAQGLRPAALDVRSIEPLPSGTYFADWAMGAARAQAGIGYTEKRVSTTLDAALQVHAREAIARLPVAGAEAALVAMRTNGEIVAMMGGRNYGHGEGQSVYNRATQARRQPGSTFKLFTYMTALQQGMADDSPISNAPITEGAYRPANSDGVYGGSIPLRQAFARSSNVAAVRLFEQLGSDKVIATARDFGIQSPLTRDSSLALGTSGVSLLDLTCAYAAIAAGTYPVNPIPLPAPEEVSLILPWSGPKRIEKGVLKQMRGMLAEVVRSGTGRAAALPVPTYGKTGTTQDNRDAWFVGYAGDLVVGVWVGFDDNRPMPGVTGGSVPAQIWRRFMASAIAAGKTSGAAHASPGRGRAGPATTPVAPGSAAPPGSGTGPDTPAARRRGTGFVGDDGRPVLISSAPVRSAPPRPAPASAIDRDGDGDGGSDRRPATVVGRRTVSVTLDPDSNLPGANEKARAAEKVRRTGVRSTGGPRRPEAPAEVRPRPAASNLPARFKARDGSTIEVELRD